MCFPIHLKCWYFLLAVQSKLYIDLEKKNHWINAMGWMWNSSYRLMFWTLVSQQVALFRTPGLAGGSRSLGVGLWRLNTCFGYSASASWLCWCEELPYCCCPWHVWYLPPLNYGLSSLWNCKPEGTHTWTQLSSLDYSVLLQQQNSDWYRNWYSGGLLLWRT